MSAEILTRQAYMDENTAIYQRICPGRSVAGLTNAERAVLDVATMALHRRYYAQFVNAATRRTVEMFIGRDTILASTDPHLNDIRLDRWDALRDNLPRALRAADVGQAGWSLSDTVCVAKEAARQIQDAARA